jgi:succinoglycan biosynthesis transport protein ExoP
MLFNYRQWRFPPDPEMSENSASNLEGLALFKRIIKRRFLSIVFVISSVNTIGVGYLVGIQPSFTAQATLIIETRKGGVVQQQYGIGDVLVDNAMMDTQIEMLKSEKIGLAVIKKYRLTEDKEFTAWDGGYTGKGARLVTKLAGDDELIDILLADLFGLQPPASKPELERAALLAFSQRAKIRRIGQSYMVEVNFTSSNSEKAARLANAIADAYVAEQVEARKEATRRTTTWLRDRVTELSKRASAEEQSVVEFKERNNIVGANGRLIVEQQLAEANTQRTLARSATVAAKARYDRILAIMQQEVPDETVADALGNSVIVRLRGQYLDLKSRTASFSAKYGDEHRAVVDLHNQKQLIRISIADELRRISEAYKSEHDIARAQEETINSKIASLISELHMSNRAQSRLHELEIGAQAYRALYDSFFQRYAESLQQQSFPVAEARVITPASPPWQRSHPKVHNVLAATFGLSLVLAFGIAVFRES